MVEQNARLKEHKLFKQNIKYIQFFPLRPTMVARHCFMLKCSSLSQALHREIHGSRTRSISTEARPLERADA